MCDLNYVQNKVMDLEYELTTIKLLEPDCVDDVTIPIRSATGGKSNANAEKSVILDSMKNAFKHFFYENRPVPVRFFREEHREAFMEALRAHRVSYVMFKTMGYTDRVFDNIYPLCHRF